MKVFVYGSLRQGGFLHASYFNAQQFVKTTKTSTGFSLYDITSGAFPAMVASGGINQVVGEVYEVSAMTLSMLDRAEGHPDFYCRTEITLEDGEKVFAYLLPSEAVQDYPLVESGDWMTFIVKANKNKNIEIDKWFI